MGQCILFIIASVILPGVIIALCIRHKRVVKEKNRALMNCIREKLRLSDELRDARVENRTLEKILEIKRDEKDKKEDETTKDDQANLKQQAL